MSLKRLMNKGRAAIARPLLILILQCVAPAMAADDVTTAPASNPASDALNRTAEMVASTQRVPGLLVRDHPRVSQIIGARLHGSGGETLGQIIDVVLRDEGPLVVLEVARTAGTLAAVPASDIRWQGNQLVLPGVTADGLRGRPAYHFAATAR